MSESFYEIKPSIMMRSLAEMLAKEHSCVSSNVWPETRRKNNNELIMPETFCFTDEICHTTFYIPTDHPDVHEEIERKKKEKRELFLVNH